MHKKLSTIITTHTHMFTKNYHRKFLASLVAFFLLATMVGSVLMVPTINTAQAAAPDMTRVLDATNMELDSKSFGCQAEGFTDGIVGCLAYFMYLFMKMCGMFAIWVGVLLNFAVADLVVGFSQYVNAGASQGGDVSIVQEAWTVIRDIVNVFLVFLAIFIGIATIVGISNYGYKQLLWKVVLAAVFVNFSITLAYFVVDIANYTATTIYVGLLAAGYTDTTQEAAMAECLNPATSTLGACIDHGIAGAFVEQLKLATFLSITPEAAPESTQQWGLFFMGLLGGIFFLIMAFVLAGAAFLLIGRFVILVFLIIMSPLGLVAWITKVSSAGSKWWHMLLNQALIAPALMLMLYLSYIIIERFNESFAVGQNFSDVADEVTTLDGGSLGGMDILLLFVVAAGFLIASLSIARSLGARGAGAVMSTGRTMARGSTAFFAGGAVGAAGWAGRRTVGRVADRMAESEGLKKAVANEKKSVGAFVARNAARATRNVATKTSGASFDARAVTGKTGRAWLGGPQKGGFTEDKKAYAKKIAEEKKWAGRTTPTSEEARARDTAIHDIDNKDERYNKIEKFDPVKVAATNQENTKQILDALKQQMDATKDPIAKRNLQDKLDERTRESYRLENFQTNVKTHERLRTELNGGIVRNDDGSTRALTKEERQDKMNKLDQVSNQIKGDYGLVDENVGEYDDKLKPLKEEQAALAQKDAKELTEQDKQKMKAVGDQIRALESERGSLVELHEASREFVQADAVGEANDELKRRVQTAKDAVATLHARDSQQVDKAFVDTQKARGQARSDQYTNYQSTKRNLGFMPTPAWKREAAMNLRTPTGNKKKLADFEKFLKENYPQMEGGASTAGSSKTTLGEESTKEGGDSVEKKN